MNIGHILDKHNNNTIIIDIHFIIIVYSYF